MAKLPVLNRLLGTLDFRKKHNRAALSIQAIDLLRRELVAQGMQPEDIAQKLNALCSEGSLELDTLADMATALNKRFVLTLVEDRHAARADTEG